MASYFIINGRVIDPAVNVDSRLNIHVVDGRIAQLTRQQKAPADAQVIDAKGCIVTPGFIDLHTHLREPGFEYKEDIASGTRAAAAGGFTTVCCMPNTLPVNDCAAVTEYILERAQEVGVVRVLPVGAISRGQMGEGLADIGDMAAAGICAISDDGRPVMSSLLMRRAMEYAKTFNLPVMAHCEDSSLSGDGVMNEGSVSTELGLRGIPSAAEEAMVARDIMLARLTGARLHVAHVSTAGSVNLVRQAKDKGILVTAEATPHHLTLTEDAVGDYDSSAKINPPLRTEADRRELIKGLADGTIDAIATDHAPHNIIDKEAGFQAASFGAIGLETMLPLVLGLVRERKLSMKCMVEALTSAPARILELKELGTLTCGAPADITIFDPDHHWTIRSERFASKARNTPFEGLRVQGRVCWTFVGGKLIYTRS